MLGPLLFIIFINDLDLDTARAAIVVKFADDTKVTQHRLLIHCRSEKEIQSSSSGTTFESRFKKIFVRQ